MQCNATHCEMCICDLYRGFTTPKFDFRMGCRGGIVRWCRMTVLYQSIGVVSGLVYGEVVGG